MKLNDAWQAVKSAVTTEAAKNIIKYGVGGLIGGAAGAGGWAIAKRYLPE
jgi:hypothetical protein